MTGCFLDLQYKSDKLHSFYYETGDDWKGGTCLILQLHDVEHETEVWRRLNHRLPRHRTPEFYKALGLNTSFPREAKVSVGTAVPKGLSGSSNNIEIVIWAYHPSRAGSGHGQFNRGCLDFGHEFLFFLLCATFQTTMSFKSVTYSSL